MIWQSIFQFSICCYATCHRHPFHVVYVNLFYLWLLSMLLCWCFLRGKFDWCSLRSHHTITLPLHSFYPFLCLWNSDIVQKQSTNHFQWRFSISFCELWSFERVSCIFLHHLVHTTMKFIYIHIFLKSFPCYLYDDLVNTNLFFFHFFLCSF